MAITLAELAPHEVLDTQRKRKGYKTAADLARALEEAPYGIRVGRGYMAMVLSGERFSAEHQPSDELLSAILHLLDLELADLGIAPHERPVVHATVAWTRTHGWPAAPQTPQAPGVGEPKNDGQGQTKQVKRPSRREVRIPVCGPLGAVMNPAA